MSFSQSMVAAAFGLGLLSAGCIAPSDATEAADLDAPSLETLDGPEGGGTQNGLTAAAFHANKADLFAASNVGLYSTAPAVNAAITNTGIFSTPEGEAAFEYLVRCGVADNTVVTNATRSFTGEGLLTTTSGWTTNGLWPAPKNDLFTCVTALMNAYGAGVPIVLTGPSIQNNGLYPTYTYVEAVWLTEVTSSGAFQFTVWPLEYLQKKCGANTSAWINLRVCGDAEENCGVDVRYTLEEDCDPVGADGEEKGLYTCNGGKPAIQTWLPSESLERLYFNCEPDPQ